MGRDLLREVESSGLIPDGARVVVGVSGGVDSLVLLHVLIQLRAAHGWTLHAATLDHGLRGEAGAADVAFVAETAQAWDVPVLTRRVDVPALAEESGMGIEAAARAARYRFLTQAALLSRASIVAVGHNRDDQAETVLLNLLRGGGLDGLSGMAPISVLAGPMQSVQGETGPVILVRPLLTIPRAAIRAYAAAHDLHPREDASNADLAFRRNRLRHEVLPLLETINPAVREALVRTAELLRGDAELVRRAGATALARVRRQSGPGQVRLDRALWGTLLVGEQRQALRQIAAEVCPACEWSYTHIEAARHVAEQGETGAQAVLPGGWLLRVERDVLVIAPAADDPAAAVDAPAIGDSPPTFAPDAPIAYRSGSWEFSARPLAASEDALGLCEEPLTGVLQVPAGARLALRRRARGDVFCPRGMGGRSKPLNEMLADLGVPGYWRNRVPLLTVEGAIAWFAAPTDRGLRARVAEPYAVQPGSPAVGTVRVVVAWRRAESGD